MFTTVLSYFWSRNPANEEKPLPHKVQNVEEPDSWVKAAVGFCKDGDGKVNPAPVPPPNEQAEKSKGFFAGLADMVRQKIVWTPEYLEREYPKLLQRLEMFKEDSDTPISCRMSEIKNILDDTSKMLSGAKFIKSDIHSACLESLEIEVRNIFEEVQAHYESRLDGILKEFGEIAAQITKLSQAQHLMYELTVLQQCIHSVEPAGKGYLETIVNLKAQLETIHQGIRHGLNVSQTSIQEQIDENKVIDLVRQVIKLEHDNALIEQAKTSAEQEKLKNEEKENIALVDLMENQKKVENNVEKIRALAAAQTSLSEGELPIVKKIAPFVQSSSERNEVFENLRESIEVSGEVINNLKESESSLEERERLASEAELQMHAYLRSPLVNISEDDKREARKLIRSLSSNL